MPVTSSSVPGNSPDKPAAPPKEAPNVAAPPSTSSLVPASESSDPRVHQLLAQREAAVQMAGPTDDELTQRDEARGAARQEVDRIDRELRDLGVSAG